MKRLLLRQIWGDFLNERDYYILSQFCILTGAIFLIIGGYLLYVFDMYDYINLLLLISVFVFFFISAIYFFYKKYQYVNDILEQFKKYLDEGGDE